MAEIIYDVMCPMLKRQIETGYCDELQMIADDAITPTEDEKHLTEKDFLVCRNCKKRIDPAL